MQIIRSTGTRLLTLGILSWTAVIPAHAHFLWAQIVPGGKPTLQLRFTELPQEKTLPALLSKIAPTRTWCPTKDKLALQTADGLREAVLEEDAKIAAAEQIWGVLDKSDQGRGIFLLCYEAKAVRTPDAASQRAGLPAEVFADKEGNRYTVKVTFQGKPAANAELLIVRPGKAEPLALKTDSKGTARFQSEGDGQIGIRAMVEDKTAGEYEGKAYPLVRHYSTLTFPTSGTRVASAETPAHPKADAEAYALLKSAHDRRYILPSAIGEISGKVKFNDNGKTASGTFAYSPKTGVELKLESAFEASIDWLRGQISNLFAHRRGGDFAKSNDGKKALSFSGVAEDSPLGRQIALNDGMQSHYRVKDRTVTEVTRTMGDQRFTVTVLDTDTVDGGKYLPRHFVVTYFDAKTGKIQHTDSFSDTFAQQNGLWFPAARRVITAENGVNVIRSFDLSDITVSTPATK